jgi:hypothetical protein
LFWQQLEAQFDELHVGGAWHALPTQVPPELVQF